MKYARRNPIYQAFLRAGLMQRISEEFQQTEAGAAAHAIYRNDHESIRSMLDRRLISDDQFSAIQRAIARPIHAAALHHYRKQTKLIQRRRLSRLVNEAIAHRVRF